MLDANRFTGLGFMASYWNADAAAIKPLGVVDSLGLQISWGMAPAARTDDEVELSKWIRRTRSFGLDVIPWGWCNASDTRGATEEGIYHAARCIELGFTDVWIANMEAPYDAAGNSSSPQYGMPWAYAKGFTSLAAQAGVRFKALAITTTPFFASAQWELANAGWVTMPQAFTGDYAPATVAACVAHMESWGWPVRAIRPLVQVYEPRPAVGPYLAESKLTSVGVVPYIVEQAMDTAGRAMLGALVPATFRPPSGDTPKPPDPLPDGGDDVELIGNQDGVVAACNRLRDIDPAGTLLVKDASGKWPDISTLPPDMSKWKAYDKLQRSLKILVMDHDELAKL